MKKILLLCTTSQTVLNFRIGLIKKLKESNFEVGVVAFDDKYKQELLDLGVAFYCISEQNRSLNVFKILLTKKRYAKIIKDFNPSVVLTFMLKPNIFGVKASKLVGVKNVYSFVEGAGDVFINNSLKWKIIRFFVCKMYKSSFKKSKKVFFLNNDDKLEFVKRKLVAENKCEIIHGIGVDLEYFSKKPVKSDNNFLMVARMLKTKGVLEYCKCARIVKQKYPDATFNYLGAEGTITLSDIKEYIDDGSICYLGVVKDVRPYLENALLFLLPSYREGFPMSIMEAEAVGRGIITTDNVGCKDTVIDGYNGFLVSSGDYELMAQKCMWAIENSDKVKEMGNNARKFAEDNFDQEKINEYILSVIKETKSNE